MKDGSPTVIAHLVKRLDDATSGAPVEVVPPPPYSVVPPVPLPVVPPAQDDVPQLLMSPVMTNMMQYDNTGLMTPPQSSYIKT